MFGGAGVASEVGETSGEGELKEKVGRGWAGEKEVGVVLAVVGKANGFVTAGVLGGLGVASGAKPGKLPNGDF